MNNTCDECYFYSIVSGVCCKWNIERHSCGEDACEHFQLASDLEALKIATDNDDEITSDAFYAIVSRFDLRHSGFSHPEINPQQSIGGFYPKEWENKPNKEQKILNSMCRWAWIAGFKAAQHLIDKFQPEL